MSETLNKDLLFTSTDVQYLAHPIILAFSYQEFVDLYYDPSGLPLIWLNLNTKSEFIQSSLREAE